MKMNKIILIVMFGFLALLLTGCVSPDPQYYQKLAEIVNKSAEAQKESADKVIEAVRVSGLVDNEKLDRIEVKTGKAFEVVSKLQAASLEVAKVIDKKAQEDKIGALIDVGIIANKASSGINPYAVGIGGILTLLQTAYAIKKRKQVIVVNAESKEKDKRYGAHKLGVQRFMLGTSKGEADKLFDMIGDAREKQGVYK